MTIVRATDNEFDNRRLTAAGYEIIAIETWTWPDGVSETEILWGQESGVVGDTDVPF